MSNNEIAGRLGVSKHSVTTTIQRIFMRIGLTSRFEIALWFARHYGTICPANPETVIDLPPRDAEAAYMLAGGLSNKEIAEVMGISEITVKGNFFRIYSKLGVRSRLEVALLAVRCEGDLTLDLDQS